MTLQNSSVVSTQITQTGPITTSVSKGMGFVYSVILDETHPAIKDSNGNRKISYIGAIEYRFANNVASDDANLPIAFPFDKNFKNLPVVNESVEIYQNGSVSMYRRVGQDITPNINSDQTAITKHYGEKTKLDNKGNDYNKVQTTGIVKTNVNESLQLDGFGKYFKTERGIHRLKLYEGDSLVETRFGQSIRFSGYNNPKNVFSPTVIIRNGESQITRKKPITESILEDINKDGSIIAMTSDQYELSFLPGTVSETGTTDFQTAPTSFQQYPSKLIGDQILINSGRLIFSAKSAEMIFYSKKNYGFISDGAMSIDNALGIDVSVGGDINVLTNDRSVHLYTGNGSIILGSQGLEPLVKGQTLVDILGELIDTIVAQQYLTPSGPTKIGPENVPKFASIKSKLNSMLSKLNQTA
jgi:hypothetical protein